MFFALLVQLSIAILYYNITNMTERLVPGKMTLAYESWTFQCAFRPAHESPEPSLTARIWQTQTTPLNTFRFLTYMVSKFINDTFITNAKSIRKKSIQVYRVR